MEISGEMELAALLLTFVVHVIGAAILIWNLMDGDGRSWREWRDWWPRDDRGPEPPVEPAGPVAGRDLAPLLPDAQPSPVRLREPGRLGDHRVAPARRPAHPPVPERPVRAPEHV